MKPAPTTPAGVTVLGILMIVAGTFDLAQGAGLVGNTDPIETYLGPFNIALGLIFIATGVGFLRRDSWAWTPGVALSILNLIRTFALAAQSGVLTALPGVFVALLIIYYLFTPRVTAFFNRDAVR